MEQEEKRLLEIMDEQKARIAELDAELSKKDTRITEMKVDLRTRDTTISNLRADLHKRAEEITELQIDYVVKDDEVDGLDSEVEELKAKLSAKDRRIAELEAEVRIRDGYIESWSEIARKAKAKLADKEGVFTGFMDRINTMALVYGSLQQSDSGKMSMWMLVTAIASQYGFAKKGVDLSVDIRMDMMLNAKEAILCGWIINELVSNALEHAFSDGVTTEEPPEVRIEMGPENTLYGCQGRRLGVVAKDNCAVPMKLVVSDNGIGLPEDFQFEDSKSLGMTIIESLALQLDGEMGFVSGKSGYQGTKFTIRFEI